MTTVFSTYFAMSSGEMSATSSGGTVADTSTVESGSIIDFYIPGSPNLVDGTGGSSSDVFCIKVRTESVGFCDWS